MIATMETLRTITPEQLQALKDEGQSVYLIDVRTPVEFREVHVKDARNIPLDRLNPQEILAEINGSCQSLYVICRSGNRSRQACERLLAAGVTNIINVDGGTQACVAANLEVVRGKKAVSLERQVRIISGLMAILGVAGYFLNPWFLVLPAMVGVGMLHSGITDSCLMGIMLSGMPWNQVKEEPQQCVC